MVDLSRTYKKLMEQAKEIILLQSTADIIHWDMETKMPPKGITLRSEQLAILRKIEHELVTNPKIAVLLRTIEQHQDYEDLAELQRRNIYLIRKNYEEQTKLPKNLVVETARQQAITVDTWKKAKAAKNFTLFKPELEKLVDLKKKTALILMDVKEASTPYDALIDIYEPKTTSEKISKIFNKLKAGLATLIARCQTVPNQPDASILHRTVPLNVQRELSNSLSRFMEYDVESGKAGGRIDETTHPFTIGYYDDVRITTHYYEDNFTSSIFSVLHEGGHALYDQNLNPEWIYQPIGAACSLGFHESQSRFVENIIGRSPEFWQHYLPELKKLTGKIYSDVDLETFVFAINQVKPSKIRIRADEVTYCLHIIIRFEIERELMDDKITVEELPSIWNQKYQEYLGQEINNDSEGVMQDTHWASGLHGYFPTYALGNIYSGQILNQIQKDLPDWRDQVALGNFHNIKKWLIQNIHRYGNLHDPGDLIKTITGEEINIKYFLNYLNEKYSQLCGF